MIRKPTPEEAHRIYTVVTGVEVTLKPEHFAWNGHREEAYALLRALGHKPPTSACFGCWVQAMNKLRIAINVPPLDHGTTPERMEMRLSICRECPAYHAVTESCGRLVLDAFSPVPVMVDGVDIEPCGCRLTNYGIWKGKASMKHAHCPANKW